MFGKKGFSIERVLKEEAEKWLSPELVKEKFSGFSNEVTVVCHKKVEWGIRVTFKTTIDEKWVTANRPEAYWRKIMDRLEISDYSDLHGKKLKASFVVKGDRVYVDKLLAPSVFCATSK